MEQRGNEVWMYHVTKPVWGWMGPGLAAEIGYVFGKLENPAPDDARPTTAFMDYWVQFANTGYTNIESQPTWPAYTAHSDQHQIMDATIQIESGLRQEACDLLDRVRDRVSRPR